MAPNRLLGASLVAVSIAACGADQHQNIIGQPELTQEELDAVTAQANAANAASVDSQHDQTELDVTAKPPPPDKKPPRPRKMDAPPPLTRGKKLTPAPSASHKP